jgi:hypothetical protein
MTPDQHDLLKSLQADVLLLWQEGLLSADSEQVERSAEAGRALRAAIMSLGGDRLVADR